MGRLPWSCRGVDVCRAAVAMLLMLGLVGVRHVLAREGNAQRGQERVVRQSQPDDILQKLVTQLEAGQDVDPQVLEVALRQQFKLNQQEWNNLKVLYDSNMDGVLSLNEMWAAIDDLIVNIQKKKDRAQQTRSPVWLAVYCSAGFIFFYLVYAFWKHQTEKRSILKGPDKEELREARLAKLSAAVGEPRTETKIADDTVTPPTNTSTVRKRHTPSSRREGQTGQQNKVVKGGHETSKISLESAAEGSDQEDLQKIQSAKLIAAVDKSCDDKNIAPPIHASTVVKRDTPSGRPEGQTEGRLRDVVKDQQETFASSNQGSPSNGCRTENATGKTKDSDDSCGMVGDRRSDPAGRLTQTSQTTRSKSSLESPCKDEQPESLQEQLIKALSSVLQINLEIRVQTREFRLGVLGIRQSELPTTIHSVAAKSQMLVEKRLARGCGSKVEFGVRCYDACVENLRKGKNEVVRATLTDVKQRAVTVILRNLMPEEESVEDDLWAGFGPGKVMQNEATLLLERVSGWSEDGINISTDLLDDLLAASEEELGGKKVWEWVIRSAGSTLIQAERLDEAKLYHGKMLQGLGILLKHPGIRRHVAEQLRQEVESTSGGLGSFFERESVLGPLLSLTTIPGSVVEGTMTTSPAAQPWMSLMGFSEMTITRDNLNTLEFLLSDLLKSVSSSTFSLLKQLVKSDRQVTLSWLSQLVALNELRTSVTPNIHPGDGTAASSDGFMLNVCSLLVDLCLPFCNNSSKLARIDHTYPSSQACRLNYDLEPCLGSGQIVKNTESKDVGSASCDGTDRTGGKSEYNFMSEIFHITARALNVGFMPAVHQFQKQLGVLQQQLATVGDNAAAVKDLKRKRLLLTLRWDCQMVNAEWLHNGSQYYLTVASWLRHLMETAAEGVTNPSEVKRRQRAVMQLVPEFMVKDMAQWFWFTVNRGLQVHHSALAGLQIGEFVDCCVLLLQRPDIMPGPIAAFRIAQALQAFVATHSDNTRKADLGQRVTSDLAATVHTCPAVTTHLGPALLHTYISVDVVVGLDVDKEDFDKYSARAEIGRLLESLWTRCDFRTSVLNCCGSDKFQSFLDSILDTLLYQLHDSLARLANVRKVQLAQDDEPSWKALSFKERHDKERFLANEESAAKGFMKMATETLGLLDTMTRSEEVARCFITIPLAQRSASSFLGFFESLCGAKAVEFKVRDMDKYGFQPKALLLQIVGIVLRIVDQDNTRLELDMAAINSFVHCMAKDADYNATTMTKASSVIEDKTSAQYSTISQFKEFTQKLCELNVAHQRAAEAHSSAPNTRWQKEVLASPVDWDALMAEYTKCLATKRFDSAEILEGHAYQSNAVSQAIDPRSQRARILMKETRQWMDSLPIHPHASIFLRQDEERMDIVRALVTGPTDTPYSLGCFFFDIYFPANYPNIPPLVKLVTTGSGTVRFNPNLYADGKVCLSLLGTWHGGDASQKWQTGKSSLYQVLVSIQSMILIADPMYNEPGYEGMQGTAEGEARSSQYNEHLRLMTARHAILAQLQHPMPGFEDVVQQHFLIQREVVLQQCLRWLQHCENHDTKRKLERTVDDIHQEMMKLSKAKEEDS